MRVSNRKREQTWRPRLVSSALSEYAVTELPSATTTTHRRLQLYTPEGRSRPIDKRPRRCSSKFRGTTAATPIDGPDQSFWPPRRRNHLAARAHLRKARPLFSRGCLEQASWTTLCTSRTALLEGSTSSRMQRRLRRAISSGGSSGNMFGAAGRHGSMVESGDGGVYGCAWIAIDER